MQKTKQVIYKEHFFLISLIFFCLILIPSVNAIHITNDYNFWNTHSIDQNGFISNTAPASVFNIYQDTPTFSTPTLGDICSNYGSTPAAGNHFLNGHDSNTLDSSGYLAGFLYLPTAQSNPSLRATAKATFIPSTLSIKDYAGADANDGVTPDLMSEWGYSFVAKCANGGVYNIPPLYVYHTRNSPFDYGYINLTIVVKSSFTGTTIPRAIISIPEPGSSVIQGETDFYGEFNTLVETNSENSLRNITISKVGYNSTYLIANLTKDSNFIIELDDAIYSSQSANNAIVYLDIADETTKEGITGATVGINNLTLSLNSWSYNTYTESTIPFITDGNGHNLSIGQRIQFAGYKTGSYSAGHTEEFTIMSPTSKVVLYLSKSDNTNITSNVSALYYYPVNVVDSVTNNVISNARLNVSLWSGQESNWYNSSSVTGKFNITGYGVRGLIPIQTEDVINIYAEANGYESNGWGLIARESNNGITQIRPLMPLGNIPISGEFNAQVLVTDNDNLKMLGGVVLEVTGGGNTKTQITGNGGSAVFSNLTAGTTYSIKATAYGYTTTSQTFSGSSGQTSYVDFFLSKSSMNPIYTIEPTPYYTLTPSITYPIVTPKAWDDTTASTCKEIPKNATFMEFMKIKIACLGFDTATSQSLVIAGLIVMFFVMFGSKYGKGIGAAIGAIIGFVLAYALGVIPFAILALIISILVLLAAIMIGSKFTNSGG